MSKDKEDKDELVYETFDPNEPVVEMPNYPPGTICVFRTTITDDMVAVLETAFAEDDEFVGHAEKTRYEQLSDLVREWLKGRMRTMFRHTSETI